MSEEVVGQTPAVFSSKERAALVARALSEAARRARFSTKRRRSLTAGGLRARRGERLIRLLRIWTFIGIVALPCLAFGAYIFFVASPQYVAEARFTVRGGMSALSEGKGVPTALIVQDTQVILNYIKSRAMVEALNRSVHFEDLYENDDIDWFSRLAPHKPIEKVVKYWIKHSKLSVQMPSGIVEFTVRAFSPEEAVKVSNAALDASEQLVNQMNDKMREDAVQLADTERQRSQEALADTRANLQKIRNEEGMLDAKQQGTAVMQLISTVEEEKIKLQQEYDSNRRYVRPDAPQMRNLQTKLDAAQKQLDALKAQVTRSPNTKNDGSKVLSGSTSRLDYANLENQIAEKIYGGSVAALEKARILSESKLLYLNAFIRPVEAQQSEYPKRGLDMLLFALASIAVWGVTLFGISLARHQLA